MPGHGGGQNSIVTVSETLSKNPDSRKTTSGAKSSHWVDNAGTSFRNPWESYRHHTFLNLLSVSLEPPAAIRGYKMLTKCPFRLKKFMSKYPSMMYKDTREITQCLSVRKPTWGEAQYSVRVRRRATHFGEQYARQDKGDLAWTRVLLGGAPIARNRGSQILTRRHQRCSTPCSAIGVVPASIWAQKGTHVRLSPHVSCFQLDILHRSASLYDRRNSRD